MWELFCEVAGSFTTWNRYGREDRDRYSVYQSTFCVAARVCGKSHAAKAGHRCLPCHRWFRDFRVAPFPPAGPALFRIRVSLFGGEPNLLLKPEET